MLRVAYQGLSDGQSGHLFVIYMTYIHTELCNEGTKFNKQPKDKIGRKALHNTFRLSLTELGSICIGTGIFLLL